ncbi:MAG: hypothetical protein GXY65_00230 [Rhodococcus sp.]|uniref:hypothetical protein n=1 Tax=Rhodococcus sp. TaxID=1831 RepID=UPI0016B5B579|nr:hypothetical protein [Rhodococcus sp. (in: high G+C Gram-positive bacteria)]NLV77777.1 hypothetical protein [Rhodococcus sp. (in: high G+C Gram-positive bacteria)]
MRRAGTRDIDFRAVINFPRIVLRVGPDRYILTADEAYRLADELVDAADKLTTRKAAGS